MLVVISVILITLAFFFYSVSVWTEFFKKSLKLRYVVLFWIALSFDIAGTAMMSIIAEGTNFDFHFFFGYSCLLLMIIKAIWNTIVFKFNKETKYVRYYGLFAWVLWAILFVMESIAYS